MASPTLTNKGRADGMKAPGRPQAPARRIVLLWLLAPLLAAPAGCSQFQTFETSKWFDTNFLESPNSRANHIFARWDDRVRITQDPVNGGRALAGMAGRVYLFNDFTGKPVDATGRIVVQMHDMTNIKPGETPHCIAEWTFDPGNLKRLKRSDGWGEGYTLFLPWESYTPAVRSVQLRICHVPDEKTPPFFAEPTLVALQTEDRPSAMLQERVVTASSQVPNMPSNLVPNMPSNLVPKR
jgi:hypothetical protein